MNKYDLEDFKKVWEETSKEGILNQFYYEHTELEQLQANWNSLREWIFSEYLKKQHTEENNLIRISLLLDKMNEVEGKDMK